MPNSQQPAVLLLADGNVFHGKAFGRLVPPPVKYVLIPA
jgi:hypothetical protein